MKALKKVLGVICETKEIMEESFVPFRGINDDIQGRLKCYKQDWTGGLRAGFRYVSLAFLVKNLWKF